MEACLSHFKPCCCYYGSSSSWVPMSKKVSVPSSTLVATQVQQVSATKRYGNLRLRKAWGDDSVLRLRARCGGYQEGSWFSSNSSEKKVEVDEMNLEEELMQGLGKLKEKCKETHGIVELLECLEREAIMGDDEGREPTDYNRRALIFDKSSRVFQALKETNSD